MANKKIEPIRWADKDHVWVKNRQFVSLERFVEVRFEITKELELLNKKIKELSEENEALRTALRNLKPDETFIFKN